jgi:hypothetical protein
MLCANKCFPSIFCPCRTFWVSAGLLLMRERDNARAGRKIASAARKNASNYNVTFPVKFLLQNICVYVFASVQFAHIKAALNKRESKKQAKKHPGLKMLSSLT